MITAYLESVCNQRVIFARTLCMNELAPRKPGKKSPQAEMAQRIIGLQFLALNHSSSGSCEQEHINVFRRISLVL